MATARNFSMSGINLGHHNLPTYEMSLKSDNVEFVAAILKMATARNFSMSEIYSGHHNLEQFCVFKIIKMSAIFTMAAKTRHKIWAVKIQHFPI
jgi:hypothetical protein